MRILVLNSEYPPLAGCAARSTEELFRSFSTDPSIQIDCITASIDNTTSETSPFPNIRIFRVPVGEREHQFHHPSPHHLFQYLTHAYPLSQQLVREQQYDLIHAFFTLPAGLIARLHRKHLPYIVSLQGSDVPGYNESYQMVYTLGAPVFRSVWKHAAAVVANSEQLADLARYFMPRLAVPVIHNGVDHTLFSPARVEPSTHEQFVIVCVARSITKKNLHLLLQAVASLRHQSNNIHVNIVGDESDNQDLLSLMHSLKLDGRVHFMGIKRYDELPEVYRTAHLFVLPSKNDSISNTALEAMASGLPIVLTDTGSGKQLASGNGLLVPPNNQVALAEAIKQIIGNNQLRLAFRRESRSKALEYSWSAAADHYKELYQRVLKQMQTL